MPLVGTIDCWRSSATKTTASTSFDAVISSWYPAEWWSTRQVGSASCCRVPRGRQECAEPLFPNTCCSSRVQDAISVLANCISCCCCCCWLADGHLLPLDVPVAWLELEGLHSSRRQAVAAENRASCLRAVEAFLKARQRRLRLEDPVRRRSADQTRLESRLVSLLAANGQRVCPPVRPSVRPRSAG